MKISLALALSLSLPLSAAVEDWTNKSGKTARLELIEVTGEGEAKAGIFKMQNGNKVTIKAADLAEADAKRLADWKPAPVEPVGKPSVFDDILDGNLEKLEGRKLKKFEPTTRPEKFYVFY